MARMSATDRRLALLEAAFRVIAAEGVSGATTRAIVAEAGMSLASFHYAFTSRDEMMHELIAHVIENQAVAAFESLRFGNDLRAAIRDGLQAFFEVVVADPAREQTMFELMQYALRTPELAGLPKEQYSGYRFAVAGLLETAAAESRSASQARVMPSVIVTTIRATSSSGSIQTMPVSAAAVSSSTDTASR